MPNCCAINKNLAQKKRLLWTVLLINAIMFFAQFVAAWVAHSTMLLADSLDMLGDALTYGLSIYVASKSDNWLNRAAIFKGVVILVFAMIVLIEAVYKLLFSDYQTSYHLMFIFGLLGLFANGVCFYLLTKQRNTDVNLRSTWVCSRNDLIGNAAVIITAFLVMIFQSRWPDILIGLGFVTILIYSAFSIFRDVRVKRCVD